MIDLGKERLSSAGRNMLECVLATDRVVRGAKCGGMWCLMEGHRILSAQAAVVHDIVIFACNLGGKLRW